MALEWRDISSFSREDKDRTPRAFELRTESMRVAVHRHMYYPGRWMLSVYGTLEVQMRPLEAEDIEDAKAEALAYVRRRLGDLLVEVRA
jgi:hypothetical protein